MLSQYVGAMNIPVWTLATNRGQYCLRETKESPEGPVLFTSAEAAERFMGLHSDLWGPLLGAHVLSVPGTLQSSLDLWRQKKGKEALVYIDARPSLGGFGDFDAEYAQ